MHQHEAKGLGILTACWVGIADLGFELERGVPNRLIEEEQARPDRAAGVTGFWIEQRVLKVDIGVGDARKHARRLPSIEPVPGRHQAELAVELAQCRSRQAVDQRLAVLPFCSFVGNKQMASGLKAVFEGLAPGNFYDIRLYDTPIRQSAERDIGRRNFDYRRRSWRMISKAEANISHDCARHCISQMKGAVCLLALTSE